MPEGWIQTQQKDPVTSYRASEEKEDRKKRMARKVPKATPGKRYVVKRGDTLWEISRAAYGTPLKYSVIFDANRGNLRSNDPNLIYPGEILWIPTDGKIEQIRENLLEKDLMDKGPTDFTILLDDVEVPMESGRILRSLETCSDGWTATMAWDSTDFSLYPMLRPYSYSPSRAFAGGFRQITGRLYSVAPEYSEKGRTMSLEGWSNTIDIVDSSMRPPYQFSDMTLEEIANKVVEPFGLTVRYDASFDDKFKRVKAKSGDKVFSFLMKLASQRGILISSDGANEIIFVDVSRDPPVETITEYAGIDGAGFDTTGTGFKAKFDGRKRFNSYTAKAQGSRKSKKIATSVDEFIPAGRNTVFTANDTTGGNLQRAADWERSMALADALTIPVTVPGWFDSDGKIWRKNTNINLVSETLMLKRGYTMLIKQVEFTFDLKGATTTLSLVPPQVYTGEEIIDPWSSLDVGGF